MKNSVKPFIGIVFSLVLTQFAMAQSQNQGKSKIHFGAYYFGGWTTSNNNVLLTKSLQDNYPERKPTWGWGVSSPEVMQSQIDLAANAGLSFFSFCWYYSPNNGYKSNPLNKDLDYYLNSPNKKRLDFNLLVVNHSGFEIGPKDWKTLVDIWLSKFKDPQYVKVNGKPLITFYSIQSLIKNFKTTQAIHQALDSLRNASLKAGFTGVTIAGCVYPNSDLLAQAKECGFDILTAYNFQGVGRKPNQMLIPIDSLIAGSKRVWSKFQEAQMPIFPVITLNWDPRPWSAPGNQYAKSARYLGYSSQSVYKSAKAAIDWVNTHPQQSTAEKLVLIYAWNEYGEGAWLTPSSSMKNSLLQSLKTANDEQ